MLLLISSFKPCSKWLTPLLFWNRTSVSSEHSHQFQPVLEATTEFLTPFADNVSVCWYFHGYLLWHRRKCSYLKRLVWSISLRQTRVSIIVVAWCRTDMNPLWSDQDKPVQMLRHKPAPSLHKFYVHICIAKLKEHKHRIFVFYLTKTSTYNQCQDEPWTMWQGKHKPAYSLALHLLWAQNIFWPVIIEWSIHPVQTSFSRCWSFGLESEADWMRQNSLLFQSLLLGVLPAQPVLSAHLIASIQVNTSIPRSA